MNFAIRAAAFAAVLALPAAAFATDLKVPGDHPTIQEAVDAVDGTGFRIVVSGGPYTESILVSEKTDLEIVGLKGAVIQPPEGQPGLLLQGGDMIAISGFVFEGGLSGVDASNTQNLVLSKLTVRDTLGAGIKATGVRGLEILSCVVENASGAGIQCETVRNLVVSKCRITGGEAEGIHVISATTGQEGGVAGVLTGNTVVGTALTGIAYSGGNGTIEKNRVSDSGDVGMTILVNPDAAMSVSKNRVDRPAGVGIEVEGTDLVVVKNRGAASGGQGGTVQGSGALIEKNQVTTGTVGFALAGSGGHSLLKNKVKTVSGNGINVTSPDNILEKNNVTAPGGDGYFVTTSGNTFTSNKAKGSGGAGLHSLVAELENTFAGNKFGTESFPE